MGLYPSGLVLPQAGPSLPPGPQGPAGPLALKILPEVVASLSSPLTKALSPPQSSLPQQAPYCSSQEQAHRESGGGRPRRRMAAWRVWDPNSQKVTQPRGDAQWSSACFSLSEAQAQAWATPDDPAAVTHSLWELGLGAGSWLGCFFTHLDFSQG